MTTEATTRVRPLSPAKSTNAATIGLAKTENDGTHDDTQATMTTTPHTTPTAHKAGRHIANRSGGAGAGTEAKKEQCMLLERGGENDDNDSQGYDWHSQDYDGSEDELWSKSWENDDRWGGNQWGDQWSDHFKAYMKAVEDYPLLGDAAREWGLVRRDELGFAVYERFVRLPQLKAQMQAGSESEPDGISYESAASPDIASNITFWGHDLSVKEVGGGLRRGVLRDLILPTVPFAEAIVAVMETGSGARKVLAESNLRLVISLARQRAQKIGEGVEIMERIQGGNEGLLRAITKYDYRGGNRFSTYASRWIQQMVTAADHFIDNPIRVPQHILQMLSRMQEIIDDYAAHGETPTDEEIAQILGISLSAVRNLYRHSHTARPPLSLEYTDDDDEQRDWHDILAPSSGGSGTVPAATGLTATTSPPVHAYDEIIGMEELLRAGLDALSDLEVRIVGLRVGLGIIPAQDESGESVRRTKPMTIREIAQTTGLSQSRVRNILHNVSNRFIAAIAAAASVATSPIALPQTASSQFAPSLTSPSPSSPRSLEQHLGPHRTTGLGNFPRTNVPGSRFHRLDSPRPLSSQARPQYPQTTSQAVTTSQQVASQTTVSQATLHTPQALSDQSHQPSQVLRSPKPIQSPQPLRPPQSFHYPRQLRLPEIDTEENAGIGTEVEVEASTEARVEASTGVVDTGAGEMEARDDSDNSVRVPVSAEDVPLPLTSLEESIRREMKAMTKIMARQAAERLALKE